MLEAPGRYGCAIAIGEGQSAGNSLSYGGPHYGFLAARSEFIRRMPGRIVGETTDAAGNRGYVLTLQTREQHIRREKATSNITTNQTLLALAGLVYLSWLGPQGLREVGETCMALGEHAKERLGPSASCSQIGQRSRSLPYASDGLRARSIREARERGVHPGYALGRDYPGMDDVLLVARHREAHDGGDRPARRGAGGGAGSVKLIYEKSQPGRRAGRLPAHGSAGARDARRRRAAPSRRACRRSPSRTSCATSPSSRRATSGSTRASTRSAPAR